MVTGGLQIGYRWLQVVGGRLQVVTRRLDVGCRWLQVGYEKATGVYE